ncbi:40826_t:CDS:2 [Gigaspora margarita]|uniref:40826_t:CDS:1 n=1 Tax=Gigaspora margarita TaxID=4874 RepID=A0ABN7UDW7_GIGMA|nr:40826_t:CDS:2 [Gigaspora margarita]
MLKEDVYHLPPNNPVVPGPTPLAPALQETLIIYYVLNRSVLTAKNNYQNKNLTISLIFKFCISDQF